MQDEYSKLVLATKVLNKEVDRRVDNLLTSSDVQGGGTTCALCIAEQDIQKLLDEIERLKSVLERCKNHPEVICSALVMLCIMSSISAQNVNVNCSQCKALQVTMIFLLLPIHDLGLYSELRTRLELPDQ